MRLVIGSDHAGVSLKRAVNAHVSDLGHEVVDVGTDSESPVDYPPICADVARRVVRGDGDFGIVIGGSGQGEAIAANKVRGARAALCHDEYTARFARRHNDANLLSLGARVVATELALDIVDVFLATPFDGGRHAVRIGEIADIEADGGRTARRITGSSGVTIDRESHLHPAPETVRYRADAVVPCSEPGRVLRPGWVEVTGDTITAVGGGEPPTVPGGASPAREVTVEGVLVPGLVNVHCHSPMTLFRGTGENLPLERWLREVLWPREARLTEEDVYWGMSLAAAELLRFGVTTTCEAYFFEEALTDAVMHAGSRAVVTPGILQFPGESDDAWWGRRITEIADFHARRNGEGGRIEVGFAPHAAYTVPFPVLVEIATAARALDALVHLHLAETEHEGRAFEAEHGGSVPEVLAGAGVFDGRVLAAHGVWLTGPDIAVLRNHGVAVAHCPQSNAKLASGIAPLVDLLANGVQVGLGTDGPASNNDLDLWEEIRLAAMLARVREMDAAALPAAGALDLATRGAGRAIGRGDLGVLAAGAAADMVAVTLADPAFVPLLDDAQLVEHLVWSASSRLVTDVWVAGRQVVVDGWCTSVDVDEARDQVQHRARRLADLT